MIAENLNNMRALNPQAYSQNFGYRDVIDPKTGRVGNDILSLDKGMEVAGFDMLFQSFRKQPGTAEKYFWMYLERKGLTARGKELLNAETEKFAEAKRLHAESKPTTTSKFDHKFYFLDDAKLSAREGAWDSGSTITHQWVRDRDRDNPVFEINYDVRAGGSFGGTIHQQRDIDPETYKATHLVIPVRGVGRKGSFTRTFKVEIKRGGTKLQVFAIKGVTDKWQDFAFPLRRNIGSIDEVVTVFENIAADVKSGTLRIADITLAVEQKEGGRNRSEVRATLREELVDAKFDLIEAQSRLTIVLSQLGNVLSLPASPDFHTHTTPPGSEPIKEILESVDSTLKVIDQYLASTEFSVSDLNELQGRIKRIHSRLSTQLSYAPQGALAHQYPSTDHQKREAVKRLYAILMAARDNGTERVIRRIENAKIRPELRTNEVDWLRLIYEIKAEPHKYTKTWLSQQLVRLSAQIRSIKVRLQHLLPPEQGSGGHYETRDEGTTIYRWSRDLEEQEVADYHSRLTDYRRLQSELSGQLRVLGNYLKELESLIHQSDTDLLPPAPSPVRPEARENENQAAKLTAETWQMVQDFLQRPLSGKGLEKGLRAKYPSLHIIVLGGDEQGFGIRVRVSSTDVEEARRDLARFGRFLKRRLASFDPQPVEVSPRQPTTRKDVLLRMKAAAVRPEVRGTYEAEIEIMGFDPQKRGYSIKARHKVPIRDAYKTYSTIELDEIIVDLIGKDKIGRLFERILSQGYVLNTSREMEGIHKKSGYATADQLQIFPAFDKVGGVVNGSKILVQSPRYIPGHQPKEVVWESERIDIGGLVSKPVPIRNIDDVLPRFKQQEQVNNEATRAASPEWIHSSQKRLEITDAFNYVETYRARLGTASVIANPTMADLFGTVDGYSQLSGPNSPLILLPDKVRIGSLRPSDPQDKALLDDASNFLRSSFGFLPRFTRSKPRIEVKNWDEFTVRFDQWLQEEEGIQEVELPDGRVVDVTLSPNAFGLLPYNLAGGIAGGLAGVLKRDPQWNVGAPPLHLEIVEINSKNRLKISRPEVREEEAVDQFQKWASRFNPSRFTHDEPKSWVGDVRHTLANLTKDSSLDDVIKVLRNMRKIHQMIHFRFDSRSSMRTARASGALPEIEAVAELLGQTIPELESYYNLRLRTDFPRPEVRSKSSGKLEVLSPKLVDDSNELTTHNLPLETDFHRSEARVAKVETVLRVRERSVVFTAGLFAHLWLAQIALVHGRDAVLQALLQFLVEHGLVQPNIDQEAVLAAIEREFSSYPALRESLAVSETPHGVIDVRATLPRPEELDALALKALDQNFHYTLLIPVSTKAEKEAVSQFEVSFKQYVMDTYGAFPDERSFKVAQVEIESNLIGSDRAQALARAIRKLTNAQSLNSTIRTAVLADHDTLAALSIRQRELRVKSEEDHTSETALVLLVHSVLLLEDLPFDPHKIQNREALDLIAGKFDELRAELRARLALDIAA